MPKEKSEEEEEKIFDRDITKEMESSYLDYAMSVITSRALPDVRDGLKPVQRRIVYTMNDIGTSKTRKSARIVGDVIGKYHPHGSAAVYEAMVKLTQDFNVRYPLIIGQGNFGSIDGDPPAAERYTEAKMAPYSEKLVEGIEKDTVEFIQNYDNTLKEPVVLPAKLPNLLLNGTHGIAVGMATDIPPHNLNEVSDALIYLIENKDATTKDLLKFIKGPDFPLGAVMYDKNAIESAYSAGRGGVVVRGEMEIVEDKKGISLIITSLPYKVNKARLIEKIGDLIRDKKIEGVKDLRDESTEDIRVVVELKANAQPHRIQNSIYKNTQLQETYHFNIIGLLDGVPQTLTLHQLLQAYIDHRRVMVERATKFDLKKAKEREHILDGLKKALDHIDKVIALIKKSKDVNGAREGLIKTFKFSILQANAILEMKLQKLAGLERKKVEEELKELKKLIKELEALLKSKKRIDEEVKKTIKEMQKLFGDERRTKIINQPLGVVSEEDSIPEKQNIIMITGGGYVKRTTHDEYKRQRRGGVGTKGAELKDEDFTTISISASSHDVLYFFTDKGKVYQLKSYEIPEAKRVSKGKALVNFISVDAEERVTSIVPVSKDIGKTSYLFFATKKGIVKKISLDQFKNIRKTGIIAVSLDKDDKLVNTVFCSNKDDIIMVSKKGKSIRFSAKDIRPSGRSAKGVRGIRLGKGDEVIGAICIEESMAGVGCLLTLSEKGFGKHTKLSAFKTQKRGGSGVKAAEVNTKTGDLIGFHTTKDSVGELITMSQKGQMVRMAIKEIPQRGRQTQGVSVMKLKGSDKLTASTNLN